MKSKKITSAWIAPVPFRAYLSWDSHLPHLDSPPPEAPCYTSQVQIGDEVVVLDVASWRGLCLVEEVNGSARCQLYRLRCGMGWLTSARRILLHISFGSRGSYVILSRG